MFEGTLGLRESEHERPVRESSLPFAVRLQRANYQDWRTASLARLNTGARFAPVLSARTGGTSLRRPSPARPS